MPRAPGTGTHRRRPETAAAAIEPLAIRIADTLLARNRLAALGQAEAVRDTATRNGNIARADLFAAVCAVIVWRDRVLKRPEGFRSDRP